MLINRYTIEEVLDHKSSLRSILQTLINNMLSELKQITVNLGSRHGIFPTVKLVAHYDLDEAITLFTAIQNEDTRTPTKRARKRVLDVLNKIKEKQVKKEHKELEYSDEKRNSNSNKLLWRQIRI